VTSWSFLGSDNFQSAVSVTIFVQSSEEADNFAAALAIIVNTEASGSIGSERPSNARFIEHGRSKVRHVVLAGPLVELRARAGMARSLRALAKSEHPPIVEISLHYKVAIMGGDAHLHIVRYENGEWLEVAAKPLNTRDHVISARVSTFGKFAVVVESERSGN
jgi:hypothetical protein